MSERDDFLAWVGTNLRQAESALHNGDPEPRHALWSRKDPVTVLGAWRSAVGHDDVHRLFDDLGKTFSDCLHHEYEVIAADVDGDLAYTVGHEHTRSSVNGEAREYTLRVTQVYRRENGEWRVVHRHADTLE
ncbi:MAG: nuclear transport factor 2 family protein [Saccharothrix sp.]|nr:nuclear transport factor 2 family protein [Saccharothrix sp.]